MDCASKEPFLLELTNAPAFTLADGIYVATTTRHLDRTVYLKVTEEQLKSFPEGIISDKNFGRMQASVKKDADDRLLVPTATGYCVQTLVGIPLMCCMCCCAWLCVSK